MSVMIIWTQSKNRNAKNGEQCRTIFFI